MTDTELAQFAHALDLIPIGESRMTYKSAPWIVAKTAFAGGRSVKLVGEALNGKGYISLNVYRLADGTPILKPCEMPAETVIDFVLGVQPQ